jgi:putative methionine-R-sulfoxide reductase with GAF domain
MSISTDLASLEIMALIHQTNSIEEAYPRLIKILNRIHHFQWVGIYINENKTSVLKAATDEDMPLFVSRQQIMQVPITNGNGEKVGNITVISKFSKPFDPLDYSSLLKIGEEIGKSIV